MKKHYHFAQAQRRLEEIADHEAMLDYCLVDNNAGRRRLLGSIV